MKLVSWNINSLRLRLPLLKKFVTQANPDVVCLQEIKVSDLEFPLLEVRSLGFEFVEFSGEKSYNGVAILSKFPLREVSKIDVLNYGHKRHISAKIGDVTLHNFYVPAGGDIPDVVTNDKFDHKLKFVDWMSDFFAPQKHKRIIITGDINIAPLSQDVWSHKQLLTVVSHTPIEVEKMVRLQETLGWIDTHRHFVDAQEKLYSWWSYRARDPLGADRGRRLDHIWVTPNLKSHLRSAGIYRDWRSEKQPSDHVPVEVVFDEKIFA